jgi:hypothetical protein
MLLTFLYTPGFVREWERQRLTDEDLQALEALIARDPAAAPVVPGTGGLRKLRFAPPSRHTGKRGANRVGFAFFRAKSFVFVVAMFAKNEAADFTAAERGEIARLLREVERNLK